MRPGPLFRLPRKSRFEPANPLTSCKNTFADIMNSNCGPKPVNYGKFNRA